MDSWIHVRPEPSQSKHQSWSCLLSHPHTAQHRVAKSWKIRSGLPQEFLEISVRIDAWIQVWVTATTSGDVSKRISSKWTPVTCVSCWKPHQTIRISIKQRPQSACREALIVAFLSLWTAQGHACLPVCLSWGFHWRRAGRCKLCF